jgi:DNA-binding transcriptional regulator YiaG
VTKRAFSPKCIMCRQRAMALTPVHYSAKIDHDGRTYDVDIPALEVPKCANCGNFVLDDEANKQIDAVFRRQASLLTPEEIKKGIESLGMSQQAFADRLGISPSTLSRWVTGAQIQQRSLNRAMRALFVSPEACRVYEWLENLDSQAKSY